MCAMSVDKLVKDTLIKNPNSSPEELKNILKTKLDNYGGKVKPADYDRAYSIIDKRAAAATFTMNNPVNVTPEAQKKLDELKRLNAEREAQRNAQRLAKETPVVQESAVVPPSETVTAPVKPNRNSRRADLLEGMTDSKQAGPSSLSEALENEQNAKNLAVDKAEKAKHQRKIRNLTKEMESGEVPEVYVSGKKRKKAKKAENAQQNAAKHEASKRAAQNETRQARNAKFCTEHGIVTSEGDAKKALQSAKAFEKASVGRLGYIPDGDYNPSGVSHEKWQAEIEEINKSLTEKAAANVDDTINKTAEGIKDTIDDAAKKVGDAVDDVTKKAGETVKNAAEEAGKAGEKAAEAVAEGAGKMSKKTKNWLIAGGLAVVALVTGLIIKNHNKNKQQQKLNAVA